MENTLDSIARKFRSQLCNKIRVSSVLAACRKQTVNGLEWHFPPGPIPADLRSLIKELDIPLAGRTVEHRLFSRFFVKRERFERLADIAKHIVRTPPAVTAFAAGIELRRLGVATPRPFAVGCRYRGGILRETCLVIERVPRARQLARLATGRRPAAAALAELIARIESLGYIHGDLSLKNILIDDAGRLRLIDLDTTIYAGSVTLQDSRYQLARFWRRSAGHPKITRTLRARFLIDYCRFRGGHDWKEWWRQIAALSAARALRLARKSAGRRHR